MKKGIKNLKEWYKSKTIWGCLVAILLIVLELGLGESSIYIQIVVAMASALGIYGRFEAEQKIKK